MPVFHILPFLTDTLSAYRHLLKMEHLGETMTGSLAVVTSHCGGGPTPRAGAPANKHEPTLPPPAVGAYLARAGGRNERLMPVTLICQLAGAPSALIRGDLKDGAGAR